VTTPPIISRIKDAAPDPEIDTGPGKALERVERRLAALVAQRPDATVREVSRELAELETTLAGARGALVDASRERARTAQLEQVVDALLPTEVPSAAAVWHAQRSAQARTALLRECGAWSAAELADRAGSTAGNRSALASAWRTSGRVVGVEWHGRTVFPAFQFTADGQPRPKLAGILRHLRRAGLTDWQAALWFASPTGWLDDRRPVDVLDDDPEAVELAAAGFDQRPT
jgi:hypothetical protein